MSRSLVLASSILLLSACGGESTSNTNKPQVSGEITPANMQAVSRMGTTGFTSGINATTTSTSISMNSSMDEDPTCSQGGSAQSSSVDDTRYRVDFYQCENSDSMLNGGIEVELKSDSSSAEQGHIEIAFAFEQLSTFSDGIESSIDGTLTLEIFANEEESGIKLHSKRLSIMENSETLTLKELSIQTMGGLGIGLSAGGDDVQSTTVSMYISDNESTYFVYSEGALGMSEAGHQTGTLIIESETAILTIEMLADGSSIVRLDEDGDGDVDYEEIQPAA